MAKRFCVSRAEIRKVLVVLQEDGLINRYVGRGTFVIREPAEPQNDDNDIVARTSPLAAMQARLIIEPELAGLAALSASAAQVKELQVLCQNMRSVSSWAEYAKLDWQFHNLIAEATGNILLLEFQKLLNGVRRYVLWGNLPKDDVGPTPDYHSFAEHAAIVEAIAGRSPDAAIMAMRSHLTTTRTQMLGSVDKCAVA